MNVLTDRFSSKKGDSAEDKVGLAVNGFSELISSIVSDMVPGLAARLGRPEKEIEDLFYKVIDSYGKDTIKIRKRAIVKNIRPERGTRSEWDAFVDRRPGPSGANQQASPRQLSMKRHGQERTAERGNRPNTETTWKQIPMEGWNVERFCYSTDCILNGRFAVFDRSIGRVVATYFDGKIDRLTNEDVTEAEGRSIPVYVDKQDATQDTTTDG